MLPPDRHEAAYWILSAKRQRQLERAVHFNKMAEMLTAYNGGIILALPELDDSETPAVANLMAQGIDQIGMRVASVMPNVLYPPLRPDIQLSMNKADDRRKATQGWWEMNSMPIKMRRRARHFVAYGMSVVSLSPVSLNPSDLREIPFWRVREPLHSFPSQMVDYDDMEPTDCIFADHRPLGWLKANFPEAMSKLEKGENAQDDDMFEVLEYMDADESAIIVIGKQRTQKNNSMFGQRNVQVGTPHEMLSRIPNRSGICPVVVAGRVTLDRVQGQFDNMMGTYKRRAKLDALNFINIKRNVFADEWVEDFPNAQRGAEIVVEADGLMGIRGEIRGGQVKRMNPVINQEIQQALDQMERSERLTGIIPDELGGESGSNIRTARRGSELLGSAIDMPVQEAQEILSQSLEKENYRAVRIMKSYYGKRPTMFVLDMDNKVEKPDYTPNDTFEVARCRVKYAMAGADINALAVRVGQKVGIGVMSKRTAMMMDPDIDDPIVESRLIEEEGLNQSLLTSIEQGVTSGQIDATVIARINLELLSKEHPTLAQAVVNVHNKMQKEQADQQNAQPQPQAQPEAQPGIGVSPENPPQGPTATQPPPLDALLASLHGGSGKGVPPALVGAGAPAKWQGNVPLQGALGQEA